MGRYVLVGATMSAQQRLNTLDPSDFTPEAIAARAAITASLPVVQDTVAVESSTAAVTPSGVVVPGPDATVVSTPTVQDPSTPAIDTGSAPSTGGGIGLGALALGALVLGWLAFKK